MRGVPIRKPSASPFPAQPERGIQGGRRRFRSSGKRGSTLLADAIGPTGPKDSSSVLVRWVLSPEEVELQLGVTLEGKFKWFVVAGGEASVTVTLKW